MKDPVQTRPAEVLRQDRVVNLNAARLIPASDYLEANRIRGQLMREMARILSEVDVYVVPFDYADYTPNPVASMHTATANMTGQPHTHTPPRRHPPRPQGTAIPVRRSPAAAGPSPRRH